VISMTQAERRFDAIVIGASFGGVEALLAILPALPVTLRAPVFVVIHVLRGRASLLTEIFSGKCSVKVEEALDKMEIQAGCVYFAPPDYHLLIEADQRIALSIDDSVAFSRPSIDVLFESAADVYGRNLLGILLTGGNEDGAAGLTCISKGGGVTVVQDPSEALAPAMPSGALKMGTPTFVMQLKEIAQLIRHLASKDFI
jgi:two-component system, chemotaxis family, protein-glutamate methylesterase/glutaminase